MSVLAFKSVAQSPKKLCAPDGSAGATKNVPVSFCDVDASWALVVRGSFDSVRVSSSGQVAVSEFDNEDLGAFF